MGYCRKWLKSIFRILQNKRDVSSQPKRFLQKNTIYFEELINYEMHSQN